MAAVGPLAVAGRSDSRTPQWAWVARAVNADGQPDGRQQ